MLVESRNRAEIIMMLIDGTLIGSPEVHAPSVWSQRRGLPGRQMNGNPMKSKNYTEWHEAESIGVLMDEEREQATAEGVDQRCKHVRA